MHTSFGALSLGLTCTMSCEQNYPFPQVFLVDGGGGPQTRDQPPGLVPCWSYPPTTPQRTRSRERSRGCMGVSPGLCLVVLMMFLLVFAALGLGAYQIHNLQQELREVRQVQPEAEFIPAQKQIGGDGAGVDEEDEDKYIRPAAHLMGTIEDPASSPLDNLRWDPLIGRAFTSGGVVYRFEDGALQVNESGLYHIYTRVQLSFKDCSSPPTFFHRVLVKRGSLPSPVQLMEAHRAGSCPQKSGHPWITDSYLASALQLQKDDRVFVRVSQPKLLSHSHYANFFGLYKI